MGRLNNAEFISKVEAILASNEGKSSVYFTQKRLSTPLEKESIDSVKDLSSNVVEHPTAYPTNTQSYPVLIRATLGKKDSKISTVVEPANLDAFWSEYAQVLKTGFVGLKKKEKKKAKKSKVTKP
ncbi:uncharacterized protein CXQ87_002608 [Candidozyma duobushaemuli]|uniref:Signal recognition particle subunit SRP14 n=2 Tax=Candidozyma TaxID=3303203 RepID=A0ABX8I2B5_9ASCO|nr:uncharacterized protein CXQ87_002608 [[Candida] duobushaemulonis]PVH14467.1 hypothetical protein CXQ87_002608 [[Candida] duobushaemulonis]QWU87364.1 hypothetical protein CA3LBN_001629 [[Candida] haemuloni]